MVEVGRTLGITEQTYHRWRTDYGGLKVEQAKRLKNLKRGAWSLELRSLLSRVRHSVMGTTQPKPKKAKPGPKPVTVSLYPLTPDRALSAFMQVDPKKVKAGERKTQKKGR